MPEDVLPLWVADMDFKTTSYVEDAVMERTKHGIFGYTESKEEYFQAVAPGELPLYGVHRVSGLIIDIIAVQPGEQALLEKQFHK